MYFKHNAVATTRTLFAISIVSSLNELKNDVRIGRKSLVNMLRCTTELK